MARNQGWKKLAVAIIFLAASVSIGRAAGQKLEAEVKKLADNPASEFKIPIPGSCHTQGMAMDEKYIYFSCVDTLKQQAWIYRVPRGALESGKAGKAVTYERVEVSIGDQYHPSGLDIAGRCLWVAVSEYHSAPASSTFICIERDLFKQANYQRFPFSDHIGALAAGKDWLVALNWDAKDFYMLDYSGNLLAKRKNPTGIAYQDCKYQEGTKILCSGPAGSMGQKGLVDLMDMAGSDDPKALKRLEVPAVKGSFRAMTREAMTVDQNKIYFLPQDIPNLTLYVFEMPEGF